MRVTWTGPAVEDLRALRDWIRRSNPDAAADVARRVLDAVAGLTDHPHIGRAGRVPGTRELVVSGTPYLIVYRWRDDTLQLLRVLHGRRRWPPWT